MDAILDTEVKNSVWRRCSRHLRRENVGRFARSFAAAFSRMVSCLRPRLDKSVDEGDFDSELIPGIQSYRTSAQLRNNQCSWNLERDCALQSHEAAVRCRALEAAMDFGLDIRSVEANPVVSSKYIV